MTRNWTRRALVVIGAAFGAFLLFAVGLQVPAVGETIGSPEACGTCHVMTREVVTLQRSAHRDLACLDCHSPNGFVEKPVEEMKSASRHLYIFMTDSAPDIIKPLDHSRQIVQANCARCHAATLGDTHAAEIQKGGRLCFECHRETPHGTPLRN